MKKTIVISGLIVSVLLYGASVAGAAARVSPGAATAKDVLIACQNSALGDYWLTLGMAENIRDPAARKAAKNQARAELAEAHQTCADQYQARKTVSDRLGGGRYEPVIDPSNFVDTIDNPFYPLAPGTTFLYVGQTVDGIETNVVEVTHNTRTILGVVCVEVHDTVTINGELIEDTLDWFAQDKEGNVWYFGENSKQIEDGLVVGVEGSFRGGIDGAKPGIIMKAIPAVGDFYRQEFLLDVAEDVAGVASLTKSVAVPYGMFSNCLKTTESSPLEPGVIEHKFYASGVGNVLIVDPDTGEKSELVQITTE